MWLALGTALLVRAYWRERPTLKLSATYQNGPIHSSNCLRDGREQLAASDDGTA